MILKIRTLISLKSITGFVPLPKMEFFCHVGTEFLNIVGMKLRHENTCKRTSVRFKKNSATALVGTTVFLISKETT